MIEVKSRLASATPQELPAAGLLSRVVIENVRPQINSGQFPIKRVVGEMVCVTADIHADGHDVLSAVLRYRRPHAANWEEIPMVDTGNDTWEGKFQTEDVGVYNYLVQAWVDAFATWRRDILKKFNAGLNVS